MRHAELVGSVKMAGSVLSDQLDCFSLQTGSTGWFCWIGPVLITLVTPRCFYQGLYGERSSLDLPFDHNLLDNFGRVVTLRLFVWICFEKHAWVRRMGCNLLKLLGACTRLGPFFRHSIEVGRLQQEWNSSGWINILPMNQEPVGYTPQTWHLVKKVWSLQWRTSGMNLHACSTFPKKTKNIGCY